MYTKEIFYPETLKKLPIWILWRLEEDDTGRVTKVPYSAKYDGRASSVNPNTWSSFDIAKAKLDTTGDQYNGLGVMLSEEYGLIFIDIDNCIDETGGYDERSGEILCACSTQYVEYSQSGRGLHIFAFGKIPRNFKNSTYGVEMYSGKRFCALTGYSITNEEPEEDQVLIDYLFNKYKTPDRTKEKSSVKFGCVALEDVQIIDKCNQRGGKFYQLYNGEWERLYASHSEADLSLCIILAFWTDRDCEAIDRIFRSSGLFRDKWLREDYRYNTISRACEYVSETITEFTRRKERENRKELEGVFINQW